VALLGLAAFFNKLATERLLSKWRREEGAALESVKDQLSNERLLFETALKGYQLTQDTSQQKRLSAADRLWKALLQIRSDFSPVIFFFEILLPAEYQESLEENAGIAEAVEPVTMQWINQNLAIAAELEADRPYLGESLWTKFAIYRSVMGRLGVLIEFGKQGKQMQDWRKDKAIRDLISVVLTQKSIESIDRAGVFALRQTIEMLESLVLEEIGLIISGKRSVAESFVDAKGLKEAMTISNVRSV
jgi:hypothetical protein